MSGGLISNKGSREIHTRRYSQEGEDTKEREKQVEKLQVVSQADKKQPLRRPEKKKREWGVTGVPMTTRGETSS